MEISNLKTLEISNLKPSDFPDADSPVTRALELASERLGRTPEDILAEVTREPLDFQEIEGLVALRVDILADGEV